MIHTIRFYFQKIIYIERGFQRRNPTPINFCQIDAGFIW